MKTLISVVTIATLSQSAFGQGQVNFVNIDKTVTPNILAIVTDATDGHALNGTEARAALLGGPAAGGQPYSFATEANPYGGTWYYPNRYGTLHTLFNANDNSNFVTFRTGAAAGYVAGTPRILNDVGYNQQAMLQMVVWTGNYPDWMSALQAATTTDYTVKLGCSVPWIVTTTLSPTDPNLPHNFGLTPFSIDRLPIPEPSTFALAGSGAVVMWITRRRIHR